MKSLRFLSVALVAVVVAMPAQAQSGTITASATVQTPLTVSGLSPIAFGNVFPGVNKTIAYTDATNGGRLSVGGQANAQVNVTFTLPANLTSAAAGNLPIGTWTGYYNGANNTTTGTVFTPSATAATTRLDATNGTLYVFLGATVSPTATLAAGSYSASVSMSVVYTGL